MLATFALRVFRLACTLSRISSCPSRETDGDAEVSLGVHTQDGYLALFCEPTRLDGAPILSALRQNLVATSFRSIDAVPKRSHMRSRPRHSANRCCWREEVSLHSAHREHRREAVGNLPFFGDRVDGESARRLSHQCSSIPFEPCTDWRTDPNQTFQFASQGGRPARGLRGSPRRHSPWRAHPRASFGAAFRFRNVALHAAASLAPSVLLAS